MFKRLPMIREINCLLTLMPVEFSKSRAILAECVAGLLHRADFTNAINSSVILPFREGQDAITFRFTHLHTDDTEIFSTFETCLMLPECAYSNNAAFL